MIIAPLPRACLLNFAVRVLVEEHRHRISNNGGITTVNTIAKIISQILFFGPLHLNTVSTEHFWTTFGASVSNKLGSNTSLSKSSWLVNQVIVFLVYGKQNQKRSTLVETFTQMPVCNRLERPKGLAIIRDFLVSYLAHGNKLCCLPHTHFVLTFEYVFSQLNCVTFPLADGEDRWLRCRSEIRTRWGTKRYETVLHIVWARSGTGTRGSRGRETHDATDGQLIGTPYCLPQVVSNCKYFPIKMCVI